ncbi:hypothetical protein D3C87_2090540 [compost metagenome]
MSAVTGCSSSRLSRTKSRYQRNGSFVSVIRPFDTSIAISQAVATETLTGT